MLREINENDFNGLSELYTHLHNNKPIENSDENIALFNAILKDKNHHIIVAEEDGKIVSSCVCIIIPNLTHNQQPYALIENVVTDKAYRKLGLASACLSFAKQIAVADNCYKMMLLTGSKKRSTHKFYRKNGYNRFEKTGYIQRLK
ncbi:MAG: GNAT family N-acetyltransferase [Eubacterium sp.]|nr:GNAT family N-acetyltransferase [Eubacterium sp.]